MNYEKGFQRQVSAKKNFKNDSNAKEGQALPH